MTRNIHVTQEAQARENMQSLDSSSYDMYPPPHMTCIQARENMQSLDSSSYDMYPPPHMTCIQARENMQNLDSQDNMHVLSLAWIHVI
jgi:hypothetical protein